MLVVHNMPRVFAVKKKKSWLLIDIVMRGFRTREMGLARSGAVHSCRWYQTRLVEVQTQPRHDS